VSNSIYLLFFYHIRYYYALNFCGLTEYVSHRNRIEFVKWRQAFDIICDKKVSNKLKGEFCKVVIWPAMMYDAECWTIKGQHIQKMSVAEMRMLHWICDHTQRD
jgi:hypothetical protein